jgi:FtsP/CotA-like multicopper oxidase with cupredoxin domain
VQQEETVTANILKTALLFGFSLCFSGETTAGEKYADLQNPKILESANGALDVSVTLEPGQVKVGNQPDVVGVNMKTCVNGSTDCAEGYGGVVLQLGTAERLKIKLVDKLEFDPNPDLFSDHCMDTGGWSDATGWLSRDGKANIHTHGLLVTPNKDEINKTYGDYVFDCATSKPGLTSNQIIGGEMNFDIPFENGGEAQPAGMNWFHPHVHGIAKPQVSLGLAGMIMAGKPQDYLCLVAKTDGTCDQAASDTALAKVNTRYMLLKDAQIVQFADKGPWFNWADQDPGFCGDIASGNASSIANVGRCGIGNELKLPDALAEGKAAVDGAWVYTINGEEYPSVVVGPGKKELWRIQNASANLTYKLSLRRIAATGAVEVAGARMMFEVLNMDGAGLVSNGVADQYSLAATTNEIVLMPGSRAELLVQYRRKDDGCVAESCPEMDAEYQLVTESFQAGFTPDDADIWPRMAMAHVIFQTAATKDLVTVASVLAKVPPAFPASEPSLDQLGAAIEKNCVIPGGATAADLAKAIRLSPDVGDLQAYDHRRIYFGIFADDAIGIEDFALGTTLVTETGEEFSLAGKPIAADNPVVLQTINQAGMHPDLKTSLCVLKGETENWELVNVSAEVHNFHIHQSKFTVLRKSDGSPDMQAPSLIDQQLLPEKLLFKTGEFDLPHDVIIVPRGRSECGNSLEPLATGNGYKLKEAPEGCGELDRGKISISIPFTGNHLAAPGPGKFAKFLYHCHILEHEDKGMMASITIIDPAKFGAY